MSTCIQGEDVLCDKTNIEGRTQQRLTNRAAYVPTDIEFTTQNLSQAQKIDRR